MPKADEIILKYKNISSLLMSSCRNYFSEMSLTLPQVMVLNQLKQNGSMSINEIARAVGNANSTVSGIIDRLERYGYVARERDLNDRRVVRVVLSDDASDFTKNMDQTIMGYFGTMLEDASQGDLDSIHAGLSTLERILKSTGEKSVVDTHEQ